MTESSFRLPFKQWLSNRTAFVVLGFVALCTVYAFIYAGFFYNAEGRVGLDFSLSMQQLFDGYLWFRNNGLWQTPWFTPSMCGGVPFFAEPQSAYYSIPMFLGFAMPPLDATFVTFVLFAAAGFWGYYILLRRVFDCGAGTAFLAAALFMFNGFYAYRMGVGQIGYHGFTLVPWVALLLLAPVRLHLGRHRADLGGIFAGALIAYWLQSGFTTLMIPAALSIFAIGLIHALRVESAMRAFFLKSATAISVSLALCGAKLYPTLSFFSMFPRSSYKLPGFGSVTEIVRFVFSSLFLPAQWTSSDVLLHLRNMNWNFSPIWEWSYGVGITPLVIWLIAGWLRSRKGRQAVAMRAPNNTWVIRVSLFLVLLLPLALLYYSPSWNAVLKAIPIIRSTPWPYRWIVLYIPVIALASALALEYIKRELTPRNVKLLLAGLTALIVLQTLLEPKGDYVTPPFTYRVATIQNAWQRYHDNQTLKPRINSIGAADPEKPLPYDRNDTMVQGISQLFCYYPIFGYKLEKMPFQNIAVGPVLGEIRKDTLNLRNPACFVFPQANHCRPGDNFTTAQVGQAERFATYRPFAFKRPLLQIWLDWLSGLALGVVAISSLLLLLQWLRGTNTSHAQR